MPDFPDGIAWPHRTPDTCLIFLMVSHGPVEGYYHGLTLKAGLLYTYLRPCTAVF